MYIITYMLSQHSDMIMNCNRNLNISMMSILSVKCAHNQTGYKKFTREKGEAEGLLTERTNMELMDRTTSSMGFSMICLTYPPHH